MICTGMRAALRFLIAPVTVVFAVRIRLGRSVKDSAVVLAAFFLIPVLSLGQTAKDANRHAVEVSGDIEYTHDPPAAKDGNTWYVFSTGTGPNRKGELPIRCSQDLHHWSM